MRFIGTAVTDIGTSKTTNQDSMCFKIANTKSHGQVAMVIVCDGMGGLEKGELASATVIRSFSSWFDEILPRKIDSFAWEEFAEEWKKNVKAQNHKILEYGKKIGVNLGTTLSAMLIIDKKFMIVHVGDSRIYRVTKKFEQLTEDQTFIARELKRGTMTLEQAETDSRKNMLLQCIGASKTVEPQVVFGDLSLNEIYMVCSDGFRHKLTEEELHNSLSPSKLKTAEEMTRVSEELIETLKIRKEKDNISVALLKCVK